MIATVVVVSVTSSRPASGPAHPAADPVDPLSLERQVCFALAVASRTVIAVYRPVLARLDLTHPQYLVMLALWESAPLSVTELGRMLELDTATLSRLLRRLETRGYVRRDRSETDERALAITLTDEGRALREQATAVPGEIVERLGLDVEELMELQARLTTVIAAAKAVV